jgi:hypothetical protein
MFRNTVILASVCAISFLSGCKTSRSTQASMGFFSSRGTIASLGAGDALGRRIYVNDMIIAAREQGVDFAITAVPETTPVSLGE